MRTSVALVTGFSLWAFAACAADELQDADDDASIPAEEIDPPDEILLAQSARSIRGWVTCDGVTDDTLGVARAFAAARNGAFPLQVDCPVRLRIGNDITRPIFIDQDTTVVFSGNGKLLVDNSGIPAFVIANSNRVTLLNWVVQYDGRLPITMSGAAGQFNDGPLKTWMTTHRNVKYQSANPLWAGPSTLSAIFLVKGTTSVLVVENMKLSVPSNAGADRFIPMCFGFIAGERSGVTISRSSPVTHDLFDIPTGLRLDHIDIDGSYFGFQGNVKNTLFNHVRSRRYADLQDAQGKNVGGVGKWFAPPHLLYINYATNGDPALFNAGIHVFDVLDYGVRVGTARDRGGSDTVSGYANSLKIGGVDIIVDGYTSYRPDGLMDVLQSTNLKILNVVATYNSAFLNNLFPGIRFPGSKYQNVTLNNITLSDLAPSPIMQPLRGNNDPSNKNITISNTVLKLKSWTGVHAPDYSPTVPGTPVYFAGVGHHIGLVVHIGN